MNEATDNVGKIIKSIIDTSKTRINFGSLSKENSDNDKMSTNANNYTGAGNLHAAKPATSPTNVGTLHENLSSSHFMIPDVDQFNSFEDFFQDFLIV